MLHPIEILGFQTPPGINGWKSQIVGVVWQFSGRLFSKMGLFLLFLDPEGYPTVVYDSYPTFLHKNPKSSQERAMELVLGLFYIIFHGESDKTTQTPWNIARTRENHDPRFFQIFSVFSRSTPFPDRKEAQKTSKNAGEIQERVRGVPWFLFFRFTFKRNKPT